jgi:hypothetical protein
MNGMFAYVGPAGAVLGERLMMIVLGILGLRR